MNPNTFKGLRVKGNADCISSDHESALAKFCCFRLDWPEWVKGTVDEFAHKYKTANWFDEAPPFPGAIANANQPVSPPDVLLAVEGTKQWFYDDQLATLELKALQLGEGRCSLSCELICEMSDLANRRVYIRRGRLLLGLGVASFEGVAAPEKRMADEHGAPPNRVVVRKGGTSDQPSWSVESSNGVIGEITIPETVLHLASLAPGSEVTGVFATYLKEVATGAPLAKRHQSDGIVQDGCKPLGDAKAVVLDLLAAHRLPIGDGGLVKLATAAIRFKGKG